MLWALALCVGFAAAAPAGDTLEVNPAALGSADTGADDRSVNLFVDIASTRLAREAKLDHKRRLDLAGVPLVIGTARQDGQAAPSVTAGIAGRHDWQLDRRWTLHADGVLSRAQVVDTGLPSAARGGGAVALGFAAGGTRLELQPSFYAAMQEDLLQRLDLGLDLHWRQELADGLDLTAAASHAWRDAMDPAGTDEETNRGRLGLHIDLAQGSIPGAPFGLFPSGSNLELAYEVEDTAGEIAAQRRFSQSLVLLARLVALQGWNVNGRYALSASARGDDSGDAGRRDIRQRLTLESDWDLGSSTGAAWHVTADYGFEQDLGAEAASATSLHTAMVGFALDF